VDTGGIAMGKSAKKESFSQQIKQQAFHAVSHAHVVIFMIDAIEGEIFIHPLIHSSQSTFKERKRGE